MKHSQCTCSCSCLPRIQHDYSVATTKSSANLNNQISKQHLEQDLGAKTVNSTMKICTTLSNKVPLERNESATIIATYARDSSNPSILMNETRFGTIAKETDEKGETEGTRFEKMLEKEEWKTDEEGEEQMLSPIQAETYQVTREERKHEEDIEDLEFKKILEKEWKAIQEEEEVISSSNKAEINQVIRESGKHEGESEDSKFEKMLEEKWKTMEENEGPMSSSAQVKTDQVIGEEGKYEEREDSEFKKILVKELKIMQEEGSKSSTAQSRQVDSDQLASADWQSDASFLPFVSRKTDQTTQATVEEGKQEGEAKDSKFKKMLEKDEKKVEEEEIVPFSLQAKTEVTSKEGKYEEETKDSESTAQSRQMDPNQLASEDWQPDASSLPLVSTSQITQITVEKGKQEEETGVSEFKKMLEKEGWKTVEEKEEQMSSFAQAKTDQVTGEKGKYEKEREDSESAAQSRQVDPNQLASADWQSDASFLPFVSRKTDQITQVTVEEGKQEEEIQSSEFKKMLEKGEKTVEGEEIVPFSVQAKTDQVTGEEGKYGEETEVSEFKKMLEKGNLKTVEDEEESKLSSVQAETKQVTRGEMEERKHEGESEDSEIKKMLEEKWKTVEEKEGQMSPFAQAKTDQVTGEKGKHEVETEDSESGTQSLQVDYNQLTSANLQLGASFLPSVSRKTDQTTRVTIEGGKQEEEPEDLEFKKILEKEGWKIVEDEERSMSSYIQAKIDQVTREEGRQEEERNGLEWREAQEGSMLFTVQPQVDFDQLASADWQSDASFLPFVSRKTDQITQATVEEGKQEEEIQGSEFKKMLEGKEWRVVQENEEPMSSFIQAEIDHVTRGTVEEGKHEEKIEDLFKKMLQKQDLSEEREEENSMSSFTQSQQTDLSLSTSTSSNLNALSSPFLTMKTNEITNGNATNTTNLTTIELIKMIHEMHILKQREMGKDRRYGMEEVVSTSEIVPKKTKFEKKRLDAAKKTDSNDIYIRNHLLTTAPIIMQLPPWNNEFQATNNYSSLPFEKDISIVNKTIEETFEDMNKTQEELMRKSRNDTSKETILSDSEMNFMETDSSLSSDSVKLKMSRIEAAKSRPTIEVPSDIKQEVHVSENDHNHDANKILGEAFVAAIATTKLPERKKTTEVYWTESLKKETISNDSTRELESDGMIFKNNYTILKDEEIVENNRQKPVSIKDTKIISMRSKSDSESHFINHSEIIHEEHQATYFDPEDKDMINTPTTNVEDSLAQNNISAIFSDKNYSTDPTKRIPIKKVKKFCMQLPVVQQGYAQQAENLFKNRKLPQIHHSNARNISESNTIIFDPSEKRKTLEERRRTILMKIKNRIYAGEEGEEKMESRKEGEIKERIVGVIGLQEEKARLEEARVLREEQMELRKHQQLYHGFADRAHLERHEQITQQLHLLAESERQHREQLEREERARFARTKYDKNTSTGGSLSTIPTNITTPSGFNNQTGNEGKLLTAAQCSLIRKFVRVFNIANPVEWIRVNCPIARIYFSEASCEQMQRSFESCFQ